LAQPGLTAQTVVTFELNETMLIAIYSKLLLVLDSITKTSHRFDGIEQRLERIETALQHNAAVLEEIRALLTAEPAETLELTAGPVTEQP
jgi:hypothetical protein